MILNLGRCQRLLLGVPRVSELSDKKESPDLLLASDEEPSAELLDEPKLLLLLDALRERSTKLAECLDVLDTSAGIEQHHSLITTNFSTIDELSQRGETRPALRRDENSLRRADFPDRRN